MAYPLASEVRFDKHLFTRCPLTGTPYAVALVTLPSGEQTTLLACGKIHNLDDLPLYQGCDVSVWPTESGYKLKPLDQQPERTFEVIIERKQTGEIPDQAKAPDLVEDADPPVHPAAQDENPMVPVLGELVSYVARTAMAEGIPAAGWCFVPPS